MQNRRNILDTTKIKQKLHNTQVFTHCSGRPTSLTVYQSMPSRSLMLIISSLHRDVRIDKESSKKKSETILFYNKTKVGVDVLDQMARMYSVKASSWRWPMKVFYSVIHMALINGWILFRAVAGSSKADENTLRKWRKNWQSLQQSAQIGRKDLACQLTSRIPSDVLLAELDFEKSRPKTVVQTMKSLSADNAAWNLIPVVEVIRVL